MCKMEYVNLQTGEKLDWNIVEKLPDNAILKTIPDLWCEWNFEKNNKLDLNVWEITKGSHKKARWICFDCGSSYEASIANRCQSTRCPYCSGRRANGTNSLVTKNPKLASEWHPTKNGELTPHDVTCGSAKKVWWLGECGHEWEAVIHSRNKGKGCPYCSNFNAKLLVGYNDMWTTNPDLASLLADNEDGYKYTYGSKVKLDWKCPDCGNVIKNKAISNVKHKGLSCPKCSDGIKYPEKFMYNLLEQLQVDFEYDTPLNWSNNKRYDFYINHLNCVIETHGIQHYKDGGFKKLGGRTLKEERENDKCKRDMAKMNGINYYIVIDCRNSELEYVKNSVLKSKLIELFDLTNINWKDIHAKSINSFIKIACNLWNDGTRSAVEISKKMKISAVTIRRYLKQGAKLNWCDYDSEEASRLSSSMSGKKKSKKIIQLDLNNNYINMWNSITEAGKHLCINTGNISSACNGKSKTSYGFKWMYLEEYQRHIENNIPISKYKKSKCKQIVQLSKEGKYIKTFSSMSESSVETKIVRANVSACCKGKRKLAGGYKWMYKEDYDKYIEEQNNLA